MIAVIATIATIAKIAMEASISLFVCGDFGSGVPVGVVVTAGV